MPQIITKHDSILQVIQDSLSHGPARSITLIICSTRQEFIDQLRTSLQSWQPPRDEIPASQEDLEAEEVLVPPAPEPAVHDVQHPLMTPTLHLLAASQNIKLVFCHSINTLRAYVSTYSPPDSDGDPKGNTLAIVDLLALHHGTSEYTLQGLSRTFALVASTAHRTSSQLQLIECKDAQDAIDANRGPALWDAEVPLLSGSVKLGGAGANWAGRKIAVRRVAERWFDFDENN